MYQKILLHVIKLQQLYVPYCHAAHANTAIVAFYAECKQIIQKIFFFNIYPKEILSNEEERKNGRSCLSWDWIFMSRTQKSEDVTDALLGYVSLHVFGSLQCFVFDKLLCRSIGMPLALSSRFYQCLRIKFSCISLLINLIYYTNVILITI